MTPEIKSAYKKIYQLKVTLEDIKPPIWRRIQVPGNITLHKLHNILQVVMRWTNSHLHEFWVGDICIAEPNIDYEIDVMDDRETKLSRITRTEGCIFRYDYDLGDYWRHVIIVEEIMLKEEGVRYPICLEGERAVPPEDCGGVSGYAELLEIIFDPTHEEYASRLEWLGGSFLPESFDLAKINQELKKIS